MNDLAMNVSSSVGIAIIGGLMNSPPPTLSAGSINGTPGSLLITQTSSLLMQA